MWPDNDPSILCYFLAAIPPLKVSLHIYGIKHMFNFKKTTATIAAFPDHFKKLSTNCGANSQIIIRAIAYACIFTASFNQGIQPVHLNRISDYIGRTQVLLRGGLFECAST